MEKYLKLLIKKIDKIIKDNLVIEKFYRPLPYSDEPKLWQFSAKIVNIAKISDCQWNAGYGGGASFQKEKALIKAACEAIERYCLGIYKEKNFLKTSYRKIKKKSLPLEKIISFSNSQLKRKKFRDCIWDDTDLFFWVKGYSAFEKKIIYIPAQLVFVPYNFRKEKIIRLPISTGGACGTSIEDSLFRGILEIIERDAFMIHYLSKTFGQLIDISGQKELLKIRRYFKKYRLELYLINLPTDINVYNFLALIIDKSGIGPTVSAGLKSGLDPLNVAIGAIEECWHSRPWIRDDLNKLPNLEEIIKNGKQIIDIKKRGLYWSSIKMLEYIQPWIKNRNKVKFKNFRCLSKNGIKKDLDYLLGILKEKKHNVYYIDVTRPEVEKYGFKVLKVIIPTLHPLYLDEPFPYLGGKRIYYIPYEIGLRSKPIGENDVNKIPHFFL